MCKPNIYIVGRFSKSGVLDMTVYRVINFDLRAESGDKYLEWLKSEEAKRIYRQIEEETGARYVGTYIQDAGGVPFDFEEWWEFPDYAALERFRRTSSKAVAELMQKIYPLVNVQAGKIRLLRPVGELKEYWPEANQ
ncbi:hypothetical protein B9Q02_09110 [Candidatus Marsarchaeota G1 archaeon BE_D]|jgi:hypothetical protein|uniref:ABM domain-containing protein n=1 Tax=Candidatus Marsarchaeota G1 archaeon BE_D TaxID=1978156 RepID=A0A2R6AEF0_9ARCH|nr:MAG: hypothetical protein B9Q02_09110 [Candidatus Marsarchaeota G1 archaeon BE_D]